MKPLTPDQHDLITEELAWTQLNLKHLRALREFKVAELEAIDLSILNFTARFKAADRTLAFAERTTVLTPKPPKPPFSIPPELLPLLNDEATLRRFEALLAAQPQPPAKASSEGGKS